ncbi:MAG: acyltransferase [Asticcacaulis sp.]
MSAPALTASTPNKEIRALTGLRGIAAVYVVMFHANGLHPFPEWVRPFIKHGYIAVDLFFLLSGFVMAMTYAGLFQQGFDLKNFKRFLLLRLARIYPLYLLMTLITAVTITTVLSDTYRFGDDVLRALPYNITMTHVWGLAYAIVPPSWSISTEWAAYLLFPVFIWLARWLPLRFALIGAGAAFGLLIAVAFGPHWMTLDYHLAGQLDIVHSYAPGTILRCLASFYIGLVAYRSKDYISWKWATPLVFAMLCLLCFKATDLGLIVVFTALIMALSHDKGAVARLLQTRLIYWLGVVSYALYLVHDLIQKILLQAFPAWGFDFGISKMAWVFISFALALAVAALAHYGFEKPTRQWSRNLIKRLENGPAFFNRRPVRTPAE